MASPIRTTSRILWKWLFGIVFAGYGVYALIRRWLLWRWDIDWQITDVLMEPVALALGLGLMWWALQGTRERIRYGAVTVRCSPRVLLPGISAAIVVAVPSGVAAGEQVSLALVCQLAEPDSDGVNYSERWKLDRICTTELTGEGIVIKANFDLPSAQNAQNSPPPIGQNYEVLTLHVTQPSGLDREFVLDWHT